MILVDKSEPGLQILIAGIADDIGTKFSEILGAPKACSHKLREDASHEERSIHHAATHGENIKMRPPIPIDEHREVLMQMNKILPTIDRKLVDQLASDYLLEALICIDFDDLKYILIRPGPFQNGTTQFSSDTPFKAIAEKLLKRLLKKWPPNTAPSGALITVRAHNGAPVNQILIDLNNLKELLQEETECFFGCYHDPTNTEGSIRIYLSGKVDAPQKIITLTGLSNLYNESW